MKTIFSRFIVSALIANSALLAAPASRAAGLDSVLDGMFINATGPSYVDDQLRGGISGGGVYVRSPVSSIQLMSIDPPRFSLGCGGIDAYLGSFSFITADRLIQFLRNVAQNAAPLAFQMALASASPQLNGMLQKFQAMAQQMNDLNKNSCQLAHGIMDGKQNMAQVFEGLDASISAGIASAKGWFSDFNASQDNNAITKSENTRRASLLKNPDGKPTVPEFTNVTWTALTNREIDGFSFLGIADDPKAAKEIVMSLIGTVIRSPGPTDDAPTTAKPYAAKLSLQDLITAPQNPDGSFGVPIWKCESDDCKTISAGYYPTTGLRGYINKQMMGTENITSSSSAAYGSIVDRMINCHSATCGLTNSQKNFLNAVSSVPAIGLLRHAQKMPVLVNSIAPKLVEAMTDAIAIKYAESVLNIAITSYSGTETPKPEDFEAKLTAMRNSLAELRTKESGTAEKMNVITAQIDYAKRASAKIFTKTGF